MENIYHAMSIILYSMSFGLISILVLLIPIGIYSLYKLMAPKHFKIVMSNPEKKENIKKLKEKDFNYDKIIELITNSSMNNDDVKQLAGSYDIKLEEIHTFCENCENLQCEIKKENDSKKEKCVVVVKKLLEDKQKVKVMYEEFSNIKEKFLTHKKKENDTDA